MICSVLIPSRARPDRLRKTIRSIRDTSRATDVEILVRLDDDDRSSLTEVDDLTREHGAIVLVGPRRKGYESLGTFYAELATIARGSWIWIMNDDAHVADPSVDNERGWDVELRATPTTGYIVQPECYQLNQSKYWSSEGGAFPIVPNRCWSSLGEDHLDSGGSSVDTWLDQLLRVRGGWETRFLSGVTVIHDRDNDDALADHRRIGPALT